MPVDAKADRTLYWYIVKARRSENIIEPDVPPGVSFAGYPSADGSEYLLAADRAIDLGETDSRFVASLQDETAVKREAARILDKSRESEPLETWSIQERKTRI